MSSARSHIGFRRLGEAHSRPQVCGGQGAITQCRNRLKIAVVQSRDIVGHSVKEGLAQETLTKWLGPTGTQRNPAHNQTPTIGQQSIVLNFMTKHGAVASLVF